MTASGVLDDVVDRSITVPDGRTIAWTESGDLTGRLVLRVPGTPGCRWSLRSDRQPWRDRSLRVVTTERPGLGASTRVPGRGYLEHADDLAHLLDHFGVDRVPVYGGSGAAPHILALAARHPDRVTAMTIVAGGAPVTDAEAEQMVPINTAGHRLAVAGDVDGMRDMLVPIMEAIRADPLAAFRGLMDTAPIEDQAVMNDPAWQSTFIRAMQETFAAGADGWIDESLAMTNRWDEIELDAVGASLTWFHTADDRNSPLSSAVRLVERIPGARLVIWPEGGHLASFHREPEVLDELLSRS